MSIYDMDHPESEYDDITRRSKNIVSQILSTRITLNKGTARHHKGKESDSVWLISSYTSFYTDNIITKILFE